MGLSVTNTLTRRKQELIPREPGKIGMYVCGPTVYNHIHLGNARAAIVFDLIRRYLSWRGLQVTLVQNYTDVDDKIIAKAAEEGRPAQEVADDYSAEYEKVMEGLGIEPPDILVKATDHIDDMVATIQSLVDREFAYEAGGSVWFAVDKFPEYGKLSGRTTEVAGGERIEPDPNKRGPADFALWKAAKPGEPAWPSPWGEGRPGWHIECSAMSTKYLGMGFDIHGGGSDLIFPHHENEIAQAEAATGESPFVRYWLHNGMVNFDDEKMSKSLGNFVLAKDFLEASPGQVLRLMAIGGHYRSDVDFGEAALSQAKKTFERFENFAAAAAKVATTETIADEPGAGIQPAKEFIARFTTAMDDDFNTPVALSVIHELVKKGNSELEQFQRGDEGVAESVLALVAAFNEMTSVLGVSPTGAAAPGGGDSKMTAGLIELAIELREQARKDRRYDQADLVRDRLAALGVDLEDTPTQTHWRLRK